MHEDDNPLHWDSILYVLFLELIVIIDQLIEGSNKVPSFIGIKKCSFTYWFTFLLYVAVMLYFIKYSIQKVYAHFDLKRKLIPTFTSEVIQNVENHIGYVVFISIVAGIVSSSLGIGGGMITNPAFASLGMDPKESSSTSNFLIIVTAIAATFMFILSGQLEVSYSICLGTFCTIAAFIGSFYILKYINKTKRSSVLLVIMEYFLIASLFILSQLSCGLNLISSDQCNYLHVTRNSRIRVRYTLTFQGNKSDNRKRSEKHIYVPLPAADDGRVGASAHILIKATQPISSEALNPTER